MGHEFSIEVDDVRLFHGYEWLDLGEPCDHECDHRHRSVMAWGPTVATYELVECDGCGCRGWHDGRIYQERKRDPQAAAWWAAQTVWRRVGAEGSQTDGARTEGDDA